MAYKRYNNSKYNKYSKRSYRKNYYYEYDNGIDDFDAISALIVFILLLSWISYYYIKSHLEIIILILKIFVPILLVVVWLIIYYIIKRRKQEEREYNEMKENMPSFIVDLENKIKKFKPLRHYCEEKMYQVGLASFLQSNYPDLDIEEAKNYSRPDIVMDDNIAIEIKWPTNMTWLKSLPDKINSYLWEWKWDYLFIVLFNIKIVDDIDESDRIYKEKKKQIIDNIPDYKKDKVIFIEINS